MLPRSPKLLRLIAFFKLLKGAVLLLSLAILFKVLQHDPAQTVIDWALKLHVDRGNQYLVALLAKILDLNAQQIELLAAGTVLYAGLFAVEGVGLLLEVVWVEYLTIVETAGFVPLEIYEIIRRTTLIKGAVLLGNVAIIGYLIAYVRRGHRRRAASSAVKRKG